MFSASSLNFLSCQSSLPENVLNPPVFGCPNVGDLKRVYCTNTYNNSQLKQTKKRILMVSLAFLNFPTNQNV